MSMSMLHVHVNAACPCQCPCTIVHIYRNDGIPDCPACSQPGTGLKKTKDRYWTKLTQSGIFLVWYWTKIRDAGMPMPALVSSMPMPSYGGELGLLLSLATCNSLRNCRGVYLKHYSTRSFLALEPVTFHLKRGRAAEALSFFFYLKALFITASRILYLQSVDPCNLDVRTWLIKFL
jgi:hypothetical protein